MTFNLLDNPWIKAITVDGVEVDLSIRDAFVRADDLQRLSGEIPTQAFAILRVLLAIVIDAQQLRTLDDWADLVANGIDVDTILDYCETHRDRFELLNCEHPFMQVATLRTSKDEASGLEKIIADVPNGSRLFTTRLDAAIDQIPTPEAARWLIHTQAFDPSGIRSGAVGDPKVKGGKGYPIGPSWCGQLGGLVIHGQTLAETLALNSTPATDHAADLPVWRQPSQDQCGVDFTEKQTAGPLQLLTWQSRRIRLVGDDHFVTGVVLCQGDKLTPQNRYRDEPMSAWRLSDPQSRKAKATTYMPLKHDPDRAMWRSLPRLVSARGPMDPRWHAESWLPATTVDQLGHADERLLADRVRLEAVGIQYGGQEATVEELVSDTLDLSISLIRANSRRLSDCVDSAIAAADNAVRALGYLARNIAVASGERGDSPGAGVQAATQSAAWARLDHLARTWLSDLTADTDPQRAQRSWQVQVRDVLNEFARELLADAPASAIVGRPHNNTWIDLASCERWYRKATREALPESQLQLKENDA